MNRFTFIMNSEAEFPMDPPISKKMLDFWMLEENNMYYVICIK